MDHHGQTCVERILADVGRQSEAAWIDEHTWRQGLLQGLKSSMLSASGAEEERQRESMHLTKGVWKILQVVATGQHQSGPIVVDIERLEHLASGLAAQRPDDVQLFVGNLANYANAKLHQHHHHQQQLSETEANKRYHRLMSPAEGGLCKALEWAPR